MSYSPFDSFFRGQRTTVVKRRLVNSFNHRTFSKEELLSIEGTTDSCTGVRCKCDAHVLSTGCCSVCGVYAALCTCKKIV